MEGIKLVFKFNASSSLKHELTTSYYAQHLPVSYMYEKDPNHALIEVRVMTQVYTRGPSCTYFRRP